MAKSNDNIIRLKKAEYTSKLARLKAQKIEKYITPGIIDIVKSRNLHVLNFDNCVKALSELYLYKMSREFAMKELGMSDTDIYYKGYTVDDYISDIKLRTKKLILNDDIKRCEGILNELQSRLSEDADTEDFLNSI